MKHHAVKLCAEVAKVWLSWGTGEAPQLAGVRQGQERQCTSRATIPLRESAAEQGKGQKGSKAPTAGLDRYLTSMGSWR